MKKDGIADQTRMKTENLESLRKQLMGISLCSKLSSNPVLSWVQVSQPKAQSEYELLLQCRALSPRGCSIADSRSSHVMTNDIDIILATFQGSRLEAHGSPITAQARRNWSFSFAPLMTHGGNGLSSYHPHP